MEESLIVSFHPLTVAQIDTDDAPAQVREGTKRDEGQTECPEVDC